ncbi:MAG TPA: asparagine synthase-related protein [Methylomirabilota bacterium]|nr:asparagine synthase-related protein [Methylomirabilota bacterium]
MSKTTRVHFRLHFRDSTHWTQTGAGYAIGSAFVDDQLFHSDRLSKLFENQNSFHGFVSVLGKLNGFFAGIRLANDSVFLASDHVRSLPLFYATMGKEVLISDDAYWIREQVHDDARDVDSVTEFLLAGIVSGHDTLTPSVKQLQAGETVELTLTSEGVRRDSARFFTFGYGNLPESVEGLTARADRCLESAFTRLRRFADGRTIVVPLSGGLDSRLIVLMLKKIGYDAVVAFTYGRPGNRESNISRKVAARLGVPWHFIPYTNQAWYHWYHSNEWATYSKFANGLSSIPHIQDWPAVWELKKRKLIPDDSVFVPGLMAGPDNFGYRMPTEWPNMTTISVSDLTRKICESYCTLQDWMRMSPAVQSELAMKVDSVLRPPVNLTFAEAIGYFDRWWWENRSAKFLINSVRVYEYWRYVWWLPFLDLEFIRFWLPNRFMLPSHFRFERAFQREYMQRLEVEFTGKSPVPDCSGHANALMIANLLDKSHLRKFARKARARLEYYNHPYSWYGLMPREEYERSFHGLENINTYLARETVRSIFPAAEDPARSGGPQSTLDQR